MDGGNMLPRLRALYQRQIAHLLRAQDLESVAYLRRHSESDNMLSRQIDLVRRYLPFLQGQILDWGCMHAPDACLVRQAGFAGELFGCDVFPAGRFQAFHDASQLCYRQLEHSWHLPYLDDTFDAVIANGVLEHVPNDSQSLTELYRVLRPGGVLILACLPNRWSYTEALGRMLNMPHHLRRYGRRETREMLLHHGFRPRRVEYHQMIPTFSASSRGLGVAARGLWRANGVLERVWPLKCLASNLFVVAEKTRAMHWTQADHFAAPTNELAIPISDMAGDCAW